MVTKEPFLFFGVACLIYLCFSLVSAYGIELLERRANRGIAVGRGEAENELGAEFPGWLIGNEAITNYGCRVFDRAGRHDAARRDLGRARLRARLRSGAGADLWRTRLFAPRARLHHVLPGHAAALPALPRLLRRGADPALPRPISASGGFFREAFFCAVFTFTLNTAAYQAEIFRGSLQSVHRGQWEAARALGMRWSTILRQVVMPQAAMVALRPLGNELVIMVKSSAVASLVTIFDLMGSTRLPSRDPST